MVTGIAPQPYSGVPYRAGHGDAMLATEQEDMARAQVSRTEATVLMKAYLGRFKVKLKGRTSDKIRAGSDKNKTIPFDLRSRWRCSAPALEKPRPVDGCCEWFHCGGECRLHGKSSVVGPGFATMLRLLGAVQSARALPSIMPKPTGW